MHSQITSRIRCLSNYSSSFSFPKTSGCRYPKLIQLSETDFAFFVRECNEKHYDYNTS